MSPRTQTMLVTWLAAWPTITLLLAALEPVLIGLPLPVRTLALSALMVPAMVLGTIPLARRLLARAHVAQRASRASV